MTIFSSDPHAALPQAVEGAQRLAIESRLYPSVILHGASDEQRRAVALRLARTLLCGEESQERPCDRCNHCRRVVIAPDAQSREEAELFHPDFFVLERDLRTSTSVEATKRLLRGASVMPFEARGQVFVIASAESLTPEAANALLKTLEEPGEGAPRHFLLLAPAANELLPTLRSRSLSIYLGAGDAYSQSDRDALSATLDELVERYETEPSGLVALEFAGALLAAADWKDPRATAPWTLAAAAVTESAKRSTASRRRLLALASDLLAGVALRTRGVMPQRILEGVVAHHLSAPAAASDRPAASLLEPLL